jgi:hypothetical protein
MRACSYHASPVACQGSVLWIGLWVICVNTLVSLSAAVDERGCGKWITAGTGVLPGHKPLPSPGEAKCPRANPGPR